MTKDDERYYSELFDMFNTAGWKHFQEYVRRVKETAEKQGWGLSGAALERHAGEVQNLRQIHTFQEMHELEYERQHTEETD